MMLPDVVLMLPNVPPPKNSKVAPLATVVSSSLPPDETTSRPPVLMMVPLAVPPDRTSVPELRTTTPLLV